MKTKIITPYKFDELTPEAQQKALDKLWGLNVDYAWWESIEENAKQIGLKIEGFDIDRRNSIDAKLIDEVERVAVNILENHGAQCDTYKAAEAYQANRERIIGEAPKDEHGEFEDELLLDELLNELDEQFTNELKEEYLSILRKEYEYQTSREQVIKSINANDYDFTENGDLG